MSLYNNQEPSVFEVGGDGSLMQCGLCFEANSLTTYRTTDRKVALPDIK